MRECSSALSFVAGVLGSLHVRFMAAAFTLVCCSAAHGQTGSPAALVSAQHGADGNEVAEGSAAPTRSVRVDLTLRSVADSGEQKVMSTFRRVSASPLVLDTDVTLPSGQSSHIGLAVESTMVGDEVCLRAFWTAQPSRTLQRFAPVDAQGRRLYSSSRRLLPSSGCRLRFKRLLTLGCERSRCRQPARGYRSRRQAGRPLTDPRTPY